MRLRAVLFDLYGTLASQEETVSDEYVSEFLISRGYEVYPQELGAAWYYVSFVDYPRHGYRTWRTYIKRVLQRVGVKPDKETLKELVRLYEKKTK